MADLKDSFSARFSGEVSDLDLKNWVDGPPSGRRNGFECQLLLTRHNPLIQKGKGRIDGPLLPDIDPRFVVGDGFVHPDLLRLRVLLRAVCRYSGLALHDLDDRYRTRGEWESNCPRHETTRRLLKAAKGQRGLLGALFYDPLAQRERALLSELEQDHAGLARFLQPWIYQTLNPTLEMSWATAKELIEHWPLSYRWMCCEVDNATSGRPFRFSPMREAFARQLLDKPEIEAPFASLLLLRLWQRAGAEAPFFRLRHFVHQSVVSNRGVGEAFGEDVHYATRLVAACVTGEPVPGLEKWKTVQRQSRAKTSRALDVPTVEPFD